MRPQNAAAIASVGRSICGMRSRRDATVQSIDLYGATIGKNSNGGNKAHVTHFCGCLRGVVMYGDYDRKTVPVHLPVQFKVYKADKIIS